MLSFPADTLDEDLRWDPELSSEGWVVAKSPKFQDWKTSFALLDQREGKISGKVLQFNLFYIGLVHGIMRFFFYFF
jgi:hypothetical protein